MRSIWQGIRLYKSNFKIKGTNEIYVGRDCEGVTIDET